ncbi:MAG: hypothetical protein DRQ54_09910 [Gammaproteobacteria bacterium]|nr:MAG: hypothetical protein DRQ54_09910 [Gammaproteobacteria bacterium]RLA13091.1 MAG: hypothetical protein DRQ52_06875 [Gammaproteobacteria bacterium]
MFYKTALLLVALSSANTVFAEPQIKPGKWRITSVVENPMMPNAQQQVTEECITESTIDFEEIMAQVPTDSCSPVTPQFSGNTVTWEVTCDNPMNSAEKITGQGTFTSNGTSGEGSFQITMNIPVIGVQTITSRWQHEYLGECD